MKASLKVLCLFLAFAAGSVLISSFYTRERAVDSFTFPYKKAGLTKREAAAHLLNRFSYGATPGQIDQVVNMGLEKWFEEQLDGNLPDDSLNRRLGAYDALTLSNTDVLNIYPPGFVVVHMAIIDSAISKDSVDKAVDKKGYNDQIQGYMKKKGLKSDQELYKQFISQNILRAAYTNNQLHEVLTDFWFNHFNVSFTKGECAEFIPAYERDVIRPNVLGHFDQLLMASAKSPAMLYFLDNFTSQGAQAPPAPKNNGMMSDAAKTAVVKTPVQPVNTDMSMNSMMGDEAKKTAAKPVTATANADMGMSMTANNIPAKPAAMDMMMSATPVKNNAQTLTKTPPKNIAGLNENYAREVMELHTLGVDGGYTQSDVTQAARILTGWTIYPISAYGYGAAMKGLVDKIGPANLEQKGFVHEGDFLYTPSRHDKGEKTVLGVKFPAGGGYDEGVKLLEMLAHHPSTAKFICRKLAVRFVSDTPPQTLIDKMAKTFTDQDGDIRQVLITMVTSKEFWGAKSLRQKTKSPFELAISSVRSLNADITQPYQLFNWINRMGQKIYYYQAPTGFPDRGQYWINTGALLNRMNFGLALTSGRIPGVTVNLAALNDHHEPESPAAALVTYSKIVMPERNLDQTIKQLTPVLTQPDMAAKVNAAVTTPAPVQPPKPAPSTFSGMDATSGGEELVKKEAAAPPKVVAAVAKPNNNNMLQQVVGIIIGSPEFQRR